MSSRRLPSWSRPARNVFARRGFAAPSEAGFTLVELMVVVAILGIMAAVAIPIYSKFTAKSRQTEAKLALAAIYTSERAFLLESGTYTSCLVSLGYAPEGFALAGGGTRRTYAIGFQSDPPAACGPATNQSCKGYMYPATGAPTVGCSFTDGQTFFIANHSQGTAPPATNAEIPATSVTTSTFVIGAGGNISNGTVYDQWTIDQNKSLQNIVSGI